MLLAAVSQLAEQQLLPCIPQCALPPRDFSLLPEIAAPGPAQCSSLPIFPSEKNCVLKMLFFLALRVQHRQQQNCRYIE